MDTDTGNNLEASGRGSFYEYLSVMTEYFDIFFSRTHVLLTT